MRWLILTDDFPPLDGGVATWSLAVARGLHEAGHEASVFARRRPGLGGDASDTSLPFPVRGIWGPRFGRLGGFWTAGAAWQAVRQVDAVLATTWPVAAGIAPRCARLGVPLHVGWHGSDATRRPVSERGCARVIRHASRHWAVSAWLADRLASMGVSAEVLPAPVDVTDRSSRTPADLPLHWGFLGRATALKGGDRVLRLAAAAGARCTVVGDGPALAAWKALAAELGMGDRAVFTGRLPHAAALRQVSTWDLCFLLPRTQGDGSGAEGFGLVLAEAAALGVATVGCDTGGVPEAVGAGLILDDPDDVPASLAALASWWTPARGSDCQRWVAERWGVSRLVARLCSPG